MLLQYAIVCPLVFLAGFVDAIAGGGGLISLPAFVLAGLPIHNALATNKLSSTTGTTISTVKYAANGFIPWKLAPFAIAAAFTGSTIGSNIALRISDSNFKIILLFLVPIVAYYVLSKKSFPEKTEIRSSAATIAICSLIALVIGIYDGFYGPGAGTFLILLLTAVARLKLSTANGLSKAINLTTDMAALFVFLHNGKVVILLGIVAGLFNAAGNYIGATLFTNKGIKAVRPVMITVLVIFLAKLVFDLLS